MSAIIVGGEHKGRALQCPRGREIRPTSSLLRKVIFDLIGPRILHARLLDLFAGIGTLGIEGLSRGASACVFVERNGRALDLLKKNLEALGMASSSQVLRADAFLFCRRNRDVFDGIFLDPPYAGCQAVRLLDFRGLLAPSGWLVHQHAAAVPDDLNISYERVRSKRHGNSEVTIYES